VGGGDAEEGSERGVSGAAPVEAEDEFVEIGLKVFAAQTVVDAQGPDFEVGEDAMDPGQDDMGGHLADDMGIMDEACGAGIAGPSVGLGGGAGGQVYGEEGVQAIWVSSTSTRPASGLRSGASMLQRSLAQSNHAVL